MLFAPRRRAKTTAVVLTLAATPALAENPAPTPQASADAGTTSITLDTIEIISQELNAARLQIQPSLGASTYTFSPEALETTLSPCATRTGRSCSWSRGRRGH